MPIVKIANVYHITGYKFKVVLFLQSRQNLLKRVMVRVEFNLARQVKYEVFTLIFEHLRFDRICEPHQIRVQKLGTVKHRPIRTQLKLFHCIF